MAVHNSAYWEDFRQTCSFLDLNPPYKDMSKSQLNTFVAASPTVTKESMMIAREQAYSQEAAVHDSPSDPRQSAVRFEASWPPLKSGFRSYY